MMPIESREQLTALAGQLETQIGALMCQAGIAPSGALALALLSLGTLQAARGNVPRETVLQMAADLFDFHRARNMSDEQPS